VLGFQTTAAQSRALLSDKAKNRTFWPPSPVKIREEVDEMCGSMNSSCTYNRTSGIHLMGGLAAAAESCGPVKKNETTEQ